MENALKLKPNVQCDWKHTFDVVLYPNSMFVISLLVNRLYTHEIVPSAVPISQMPTRMGYVIRCSKASAIHAAGETHLLVDGVPQRLVEVKYHVPCKMSLPSFRFLDNGMNGSARRPPQASSAFGAETGAYFLKSVPYVRKEKPVEKTHVKNLQ